MLRGVSNSAPASNTVVADANTSGEAAPATTSSYDVSDVTVEVADDAEGDIDFSDLQVAASGSENPQTIPFSNLDPEYTPEDDGSGSSLWWLWLLLAFVILGLIIAIAYYVQNSNNTETGYIAAPVEGKPYKITSKDKEELISSIQPARKISTRYVEKPENGIY
jgi:hypothetical protein